MADSVTTNTEQTRWTGRVKWFNNQAGYGFLTADVEGSEQDIFVHHSALVTGQDQFRYLVEGEYVSFVTVSGDDGKTTASDVTGAGGGKLMCETRWERKQAIPLVVLLAMIPILEMVWSARADLVGTVSDSVVADLARATEFALWVLLRRKTVPFGSLSVLDEEKAMVVASEVDVAVRVAGHPITTTKS